MTEIAKRNNSDVMGEKYSTTFGVKNYKSDPSAILPQKYEHFISRLYALFNKQNLFQN